MKKIAFTTIEAIVVIGILALLSVIILGWQSDIFSLNTLFSKRLSTQEEIRKTIKNFIAEVRSAQPSSLGSYPIEEAKKDSFIFYSNIDSDNLIERIRYFLDGKILKKGIIKPTGQPLRYDPNNEIITEVTHNLINPNNEIFHYYDENYDGTGNPLPQPVDILAIRLVKITIIVDEDINRPPGPISGTSQVTIRNLKTNL
ncbi:MAG: type II secretion system protein [Patescibacteria group bacterium]